MFRPQRTGSHWCSSERPAMLWSVGSGTSAGHFFSGESPLHDMYAHPSTANTISFYAPTSPDDHIGASRVFRSGNVELLPSDNTLNYGVALASPPNHDAPAYQYTINMTSSVAYPTNKEYTLTAWFAGHVTDSGTPMGVTNWHRTGAQWNQYGATIIYLIQLPMTINESVNSGTDYVHASVKTDLVLMDSVAYNDNEYTMPAVFWSFTNLDDASIGLNASFHSNIHRYQGDVSTFEPLR